MCTGSNAGQMAEDDIDHPIQHKGHCNAQYPGGESDHQGFGIEYTAHVPSGSAECPENADFLGSLQYGNVSNDTDHMGAVGAILAILGVVAAPITSGDTAFRSARLIAADFLHLSQKSISKRLMLCLPLFAITTGLFFIDFNALWRYFAWTNQTLACIMLWAAAVWLAKQRKFYWIALLPALFMTVVCTSYILIAPEGFGLSLTIGISAGLAMMAVLALLFWKFSYSLTK